MKSMLARQQREVEIYKRDLSAWFKQQRRQQEETRILEGHTARERAKVPRTCVALNKSNNHLSDKCACTALHH